MSTLIKKLFITSVILGFGSFALIEPAFSQIHHFVFLNLESSLMEPLFFGSFAIAIITLYLLFFNNTIQLLWWRWARWVMLGFVPLILTGTTSGSYTWIGRTELTILCGFIFSGLTVAFTLYQRFYKKTGV